MNTTTSTQQLLNAIDQACKSFGPDTTLRQLLTLLLVAQSGSSGVDGVTLERRSGSSQASTSRNLKLYGPRGAGLVEFFLDAEDGRRRLARITPKGLKVLRGIASAM